MEVRNPMMLNPDALNDMYFESWGGNTDLSLLQKRQSGVIKELDEKGFTTDKTLVHFSFRYNIPAKEAARLLIKRLTEFMDECDRYYII